MALVKGPLLSLEASGSIRKTIVFSQWKGRNYVRGHVIPFNPSTALQVNVRTAMALLVAAWQGEVVGYQTTWDEYGKTFNLSGFNTYVKRGMDEYVIQITTAVTPVSVSVTGDPPADVWVWA
ncbi:hypothetical protein KAR91_23525 [Candidatus Pacearchaeota archaeon]|nr:hypothetical protein [Candidatus Pacearchaeota archaeon]